MIPLGAQAALLALVLLGLLWLWIGEPLARRWREVAAATAEKIKARALIEADPVAGLRRELARWGIDVSDLTDEELIERTNLLGKAAAEAGVTADEAAEAFRQLAVLDLRPYIIGGSFTEHKKGEDGGTPRSRGLEGGRHTGDRGREVRRGDIPGGGVRPI